MDPCKNIALLIISFLFASCSQSEKDSKESDSLPPIFPDYCNVTIPVNIAPLNFKLKGDHDKIIAVIEGKNERIRIEGKDYINIPMKKWKGLLKANQDGSLGITVYSSREKKWIKYRPFNIHVSKESIDPWIVYRLVAPGYESWSEMGIYQRNLTSFRSEPVINNRLLPGACMNCHSFRSNNPDDMMFHLRGDISATIILQDGKSIKVNTKIKETISNCVYPYWHPSEDFIAFSVNNISQVFHSVKEKRIEVIDSRSDIVVYDIKNNRLLTSKLISSEESFETFPSFVPDGKSLVFCSATMGKQPENYDKVKYSLCKISFDALTGSFGNRIDTLVSSFKTGKSVSYPRVSPDGRHLVFTLSDYGNFSIWHREADLHRLDMASGKFNAINSINSSETESYHSWSSDSHWLVFSSRRMDGLYTHPYISYMDTNGVFSKPFLVPQKDPAYYEQLLMSFNVPEFVTGKVKTDGRSLLKTIETTAKDATFEIKE